MSWPNPQTAYLATGITTIRWGTDGVMANTSPNGSGGGSIYASGAGGIGYYTVESIRANDEVDTIYIEQGTGLKATRIQIWQGRRFTLTVVDDTLMTPPLPSTYVSIIDVMQGVDTTIFTARVIDNGYNTARKVEGKREITCEVLTLIELAGALP